MAKTSIKDRPMIIVSVSTQKWDISKNSEGTIELKKDSKIIKPKSETLVTGRFAILCGRYYTEYLLPSGKKESCYWCHRDGTKFEFKTAKAALQVFKQKAMSDRCQLRRVSESYFNTETKETTTDKQVAKNWFKGRNPLFMSSCQYQRGGMWIDPGTDYVTVTVYYTNRIQRQGFEPWKVATENIDVGTAVKALKPISFRLYNDGTISHFIKGSLHSTRTYCAERTNYRSLDIRFPNLYRLVTTFCDLRSKELIGPDGLTNQLCPESLKILKKCGFPDTYWCWGSSKREFKDTYDLINFATHVQDKQPSKTSTPINKFLEDKPFDKDHLVVPYNDGVIIRIPGYREIWANENNTRTLSHQPYRYENINEPYHLVYSGPYERFRVWIRKDGKKRSCQELVHEGTLWKTTMWSNVDFPEPNKRYIGVDDPDLTPEARNMRLKGNSTFSSFVSSNYAQVFELLDCLKRIASTDFVQRHPELKEGSHLYGLLSSFFTAPKLTETLIKIGKGDWFLERGSSFYYQSRYFSLHNVLTRFNINDRSSYKESAHKSLYANLGVSKEQFNWLATAPHSSSFMEYFSHKNFRLPGTQSEFYHEFASIPLKYLKATNEAVISVMNQTRSEYYRAANTISQLFERGICFTDLEKIMKKNLDLVKLDDYLRMRKECNEQYRITLNFDIRAWPLIPTSQTDLEFSHNRILDLYNLGRANVERFYREEEERRMLERQERYATRYKTLKKMNYEEPDNDRIIVVPEKLQELVVEGQVLHHCVGSFVTSVSEGKDTIVFLRRKDTKHTPYATISLLKRGDAWYIDQAHTAHNGSISQEDMEFLQRWGKVNNVLPESIKLQYGLHCHH